MNSSGPPSTRFCPSAGALSDCQPRLRAVVVQSSLLAAVAYDHELAILQLEFRGGAVYQYFRVPRQTYQDLLRADSPGAYFNRHIRSVFSHARLAPDSRPVPARPSTRPPSLVKT